MKSSFSQFLKQFAVHTFCFDSVLKIQPSIIDHFAPFRTQPLTKMSFLEYSFTFFERQYRVELRFLMRAG